MVPVTLRAMPVLMMQMKNVDREFFDDHKKRIGQVHILQSSGIRPLPPAPQTRSGTPDRSPTGCTEQTEKLPATRPGSGFRFVINNAFVLPAILSILFSSVPAAMAAGNEDGANDETLTAAAPKQRDPVALGLFMGPLFGPTAIDLFDTYNSVLGGPGREFDASSLIGATTRIPAGDYFRISLSLESYSLRFSESYSQEIFPDGRGTPDKPKRPVGSRTISEDMQVRVIPAFLSLEVMPVKSQFQTYAGLGVGAAFGWVFWSEAVASTWSDDTRSGGLHLDENYVAPAARIYAGTQLGFDEHAHGSSLHSMFVEARYSFIGASFPFFSAISDQFDPPIQALDDDYRLNAGGFSIVAGITIEFRQEAGTSR